MTNVKHFLENIVKFVFMLFYYSSTGLDLQATSSEPGCPQSTIFYFVFFFKFAIIMFE